MPSKRKSDLDERLADLLIPHVIRYQILKGVITEKTLKRPKTLRRIVDKHADEASKSFTIVTTLHEKFVDDAVEMWRRGHHLQAMVLFAVAVEQSINSSYRLLFQASGVPDEEITNIIRSTSIDAKLTWVMRLAAKDKFPPSLVKRLRRVFEIRNSIVHYKAVPSRIDKKGGSHDSIEQSMELLGRMSFRRDFEMLDRFLNRTVHKNDSTFQLAFQAYEVLKQNKLKTKRTQEKQPK